MIENDLKKFNEMIKKRSYTAKEAKSFVNELSDAIIGMDETNKKDIKGYFIALLKDDNNFKYYPFGEIMYFFIFNFDEFCKDEKSRIVLHAIEKFREICSSENDMVPFVAMDFISRYCDDAQKRFFQNSVKENYSDFTKDEKRYLELAISRLA